MGRLRRLLCAICISAWPAVAGAADPIGPAADPESLLPPALDWDGASRRWIAALDNPWRTPAEVSGFRATPDYHTTVAWIERLVEASPRLHLTSLGQSLEGRPMR